MASKVAYFSFCSAVLVLPKSAQSAQTVENLHSFFNVSYTWYKSLLSPYLSLIKSGLNILMKSAIFVNSLFRQPNNYSVIKPSWIFVPIFDKFGYEKPQNTFDFEQFSKQIFNLISNFIMEAEKQQYQTKYNSVPSLNIRDKILNYMVVILYHSYITLFFIRPNIIVFRP